MRYVLRYISKKSHILFRVAVVRSKKRFIIIGGVSVCILVVCVCVIPPAIILTSK